MILAPKKRSKLDHPELVIVVQGRFHAFELAKALLRRGLAVRVLTNYPSFVLPRFGLSKQNTSSFPSHGLIQRLAYRYQIAKDGNAMDRWLHRSFSRWAARQVHRLQPNLVHAFSGVALELFEDLQTRSPKIRKSLVRGSAHIRTQHQILLQEQKRAGTPIELPSQWMIDREMREYDLADNIVTLSSFAHQSFIDQQVPSDKLVVIPLGSDVRHFRPSRAVIDARINRLKSGARLQILFTGNISLQKGVIDLIKVAEALKDQCEFHLVGNVTPDADVILRESAHLFKCTPRQPEGSLSAQYNAADLYLFTTLQDGFAVVLAQAKAACLPILATQNCAAPDLVEEGVTGHIFPIRRPDLFIQRLQAWNQDRSALIAAIEALWCNQSQRDWSQVADDFLATFYPNFIVPTSDACQA
jgi:glycosyltransferase involved in cell wall biosynthesis